MRPAPDERVVAWLRRHAHQLAVPTIVIGELQYGVARLAPGRRKVSLQSAIDGLVSQFASQVLSYDLQAAQVYARDACCIRGATPNHESRGRPDCSDRTGLTLINPWRG